MADESVPVVSNTGPLISAFQSDSFDLIRQVLGIVHTTESCRTELTQHGWQANLDHLGDAIIYHSLTTTEAEQALKLARRIAEQPVSKDRASASHLGEAEAIVLAHRTEFSQGVLLLDERAARTIAIETGLTISGFAGILLLAVEQGLITADELRKRLERCRQLGTHYSVEFIEQVYRSAQEHEP